MQRERGDKDDFFDPGKMFAGLGGFGGPGSNRSMFSNMFGGRDPFDDPFFTRPLGGNTMFDSGSFRPSGHSSDTEQKNASNGVLIEEIHSEDEEEEEGKKATGTEAKKNKPQQLTQSSYTEPSIEHPDDDVDATKIKQVQYRNDHRKAEAAQPQVHSFSFKKVTYGGVDGAYYTASSSKRAGSDGVMVEDSKEADMTTGQATHRFSRGINDKGRSVTRKLGPDGKVDSMQTLHNLEKEELAGFEEAWKGNVQKHLPGWKEGSRTGGDGGFHGDSRHRGRWDGWALPSIDHFERGARPENKTSPGPSAGRPKNVVRINIE